MSDDEDCRKIPKHQEGTDVGTNRGRGHGRWTAEEIRRFQHAASVCEWGQWADMSLMIGSRSTDQVRRFALSERGARILTLATPMPVTPDPLRVSIVNFAQAAANATAALATSAKPTLVVSHHHHHHEKDRDERRAKDQRADEKDNDEDDAGDNDASKDDKDASKNDDE